MTTATQVTRAKCGKISHDRFDLPMLNAKLAGLDPVELVRWSIDNFGDCLVMSTSFGIQSAAMLHLVTQVRPNIPVLWVDTGYLPAETYRYADQLTKRLDLNLHVVQSEMSPARMEATHGRLWESDDPADLDLYDRIRKVEPMRRALDDFGVQAWLAGLRASQTDYRRDLPRISFDGGRYKILPILHWSSRETYYYLERHGLPHHPLFEQGYATVGDWHNSRPLKPGESPRDQDARHTRYHGLKQECGLHLPGAMSGQG